MGNLKLIGDSTIPSGEYGDIKIVGDAKALGYVKADLIKVTGDAEFEEEINVGELKIVGDFKVKKRAVVTKVVRVVGDAKFCENVNFKECKISGDAEFKNGFEGGELKVLGDCEIIGDCEIEKLIIKGCFKVTGLLTADNIEILLADNCKIKEIGGENIKVFNKDESRGILFSKKYNNKLKSSIIEGDNIILANTMCEIVRGKNIIIKDGCRIEKIEYTQTLNVDKNSEVGESIWMKN